MAKKREYTQIRERCQLAIRAAVHRVGDDDGHLEALALLGELSAWIEGQLAWAAISTHHEGATWDEIGEALGITKQSARERFQLRTRPNRSGTQSPS